MRPSLVIALATAVLLSVENPEGEDSVPLRAPRSDDAAVGEAIEQALTHGRPPARRAALGEQLRALYEPSHLPLWTTNGRPTDLALRSMDALRQVDSHGLEAEDYGVGALDTSVRNLGAALEVDRQATASFEVSLSLSVLRYLFDVHQGRVNPRELSFDFAVAAGEHDFAKLIREMSSLGQYRDLAAQVEPRLPQYRRLMSALSVYRSLACDPELAPAKAPGRAVVKKLAEGQAYADRPRLVHILQALGDLPSGEPLPEGDVYGGSLVAAVMRFQARHGLEADGVLGGATFRQLNLPLDHRIRQIEWAMERLRWLPHLQTGRFIIVNVPAFRLVAFESWDSRRPALEMNVVVGRAALTRTPFFAGAMRHVVFRPYWYPPRSIIESEIIPTLQRNDNYLAENQMELVRGREERAVTMPRGVDELAAGTVRLRQRPGEHNALGLLKFVLPNSYDVSLHDTPDPGLFARSRRDFSHGCIRVQRPIDLAEFVLGDPAWTRGEIEGATRGNRTLRVDLKEPVPVLIFYTTTIVRPDGTIEFFDDIYGEDAKLEEHLARRRGHGGPDRGSSSG